MSNRVLLLLLVLSGCVKSETKQCGQYTCGQISVCAPSGDRCVSTQQLEACQSKSDGDACTVAGIDMGVCDREVCIAGGCGNTIVETQSDEVCDDGNRVSGDGCRADCKSTEVCGDGITDITTGELCDCGTDMQNLPVGCTEINSSGTTATCRTNCTLASCGDGFVDRFEFCDDGNTEPGDGCRADCAGRWTRMTSTTLAPIVSVWAASPNDAWATAPNRVLHWDGFAWSDRTPPQTSPEFTKVWGLSAQDVFVISRAAGGLSKVWLYSNGSWQDKTPTGSIQWTAMHSTGTNLWILGWVTTSGYASGAHWNGTSFDSPESTALQVGEPTDAYVSPDGRIYFVANSLFARYPATSLWNIAPGTEQMHLFAGASATDMTGYSETTNSLSHYNGTAFTAIDESSYFLVNAVHMIAGLSLAVGSQGAVVTCDATTCTPSPTGVTNSLVDVFVLNPKQAFIVGDFGTILY